MQIIQAIVEGERDRPFGLNPRLIRAKAVYFQTGATTSGLAAKISKNFSWFPSKCSGSMAQHTEKKTVQVAEGRVIKEGVRLCVGKLSPFRIWFKIF
jgi:hypothetical protein